MEIVSRETRRRKVRLLRFRLRRKLRSLPCSSSPHKAEGRLCGGPLFSKVRSAPLPPAGKAPRAPLLLLSPQSRRAALWGAPCIAKSALFRFPLRGKLRTLPCSSSPHKAKGRLCWGPLLERTVNCGPEKALSPIITRKRAKWFQKFFQGRCETVAIDCQTGYNELYRQRRARERVELSPRGKRSNADFATTRGPRKADLQALWGAEEQGSGRSFRRSRKRSLADFATTRFT